MCDDYFIDAFEMGLILGITDELEEEAKTPLTEEPLSPDEMLKTPFDDLDIDDDF